MVLVYADEYREASQLKLKFSSDLDSLCRRDYGHPFFYREIPCLDIDEFERSCSGQNDCTMDGAVGIGTYENNSIKDKRFLLVELRLGYTNANNLDYRNMTQKIEHTKDILSGSKIHSSFVFIFKPDVSAVAKSCFQRKMRQEKRFAMWEAMSPEEFLGAIESRENLPYVPINNTEEISKEFENAFSKGEAKYVTFYDYWIKKVDQYRDHYKFAEASSILTALMVTLRNRDNEDSKDVGYIKLMIEEIERKLTSINRQSSI